MDDGVVVKSVPIPTEPPDVMRTLSSVSLTKEVPPVRKVIWSLAATPNPLFECPKIPDNGVAPSLCLEKPIPAPNCDSSLCVAAYICTDLFVPTVNVEVPPSATENTSVDPSYKFRISAVPLCVIATPTTLLLFAPTSMRSTPIKFVSSVDVDPSTVKLLVTLRS